MELRNHTADAALDAWNELYSALKGAARERNLEFRRPEEFSLLIQNKARLGSLRVWFLPELKKLRYNAGKGCLQLNAVERPDRAVVFEKPDGVAYSVQEVCEFVLEQLEESPADGLCG